jgi:hypothetical protein
MNSVGTTILLSLSVVLISATGCHESGVWSDDKKNWKRIFRVDKPPNVEVLNSWFSRSPHWSYEYEYFIHIKRNDSFSNHLFGLNKMKRLESSEEISDAARFSQNKPEWFAPKLPGMYEIWIYESPPRGEFKVLVDKESGDLHLTDCQL